MGTTVFCKGLHVIILVWVDGTSLTTLWYCNKISIGKGWVHTKISPATLTLQSHAVSHTMEHSCLDVGCFRM